MALPPTKLKDMLYGCRDAGAVFDELCAAGCLTQKASDDRDTILGLVAQVEQRMQELTADSRQPTGPNNVDLLADALEQAGVLSQHGRKLATEMA